VNRRAELAGALVAPPSREEFAALEARVAELSRAVARREEWAVGVAPPTVSEPEDEGEAAS
jgi:hypothetical protein